MARGFRPRIATGNALLEGDVVYFTAEGEWSRDIREAAVAAAPGAADDLLERAQQFPDAVAGVYLAEVPVAQEIAEAFADLARQHGIGPLKVKISGCINACGHHHVGILGLDRAGVENCQITLGGDGTGTATIGRRAGPGFAYDGIVPAIERLVEACLEPRAGGGETFLATYRRLGAAPFKSALYPPEVRSDAA